MLIFMYMFISRVYDVLLQVLCELCFPSHQVFLASLAKLNYCFIIIVVIIHLWSLSSVHSIGFIVCRIISLVLNSIRIKILIVIQWSSVESSLPVSVLYLKVVSKHMDQSSLLLYIVNSAYKWSGRTTQSPQASPSSSRSLSTRLRTSFWKMCW